MVEIEVYGNEHGGEIALRGTNIAREKRFYTDAGICTYGRGVYLYNHTNRYWHTPGRGNVVELRNLDGKKIKDVGTSEIITYDPQNWNIKGHKPIPQKVKEFWIKLLNKSKRR